MGTPVSPWQPPLTFLITHAMWRYDSLPLDCEHLEDKVDSHILIFLAHLTDLAHGGCAVYILFTPPPSPLSALLTSTSWKLNCMDDIIGISCLMVPLSFG